MDYPLANHPKPQVYKVHFFNEFEVRELDRLLVSGEYLLGIVSGFCSLGTGLLCVTNQRVLMVDKKMIRFHYKERHFEAIDTIHFSRGLFSAKLFFSCHEGSFEFKTWQKDALHMISRIVAEKIAVSRHECEHQSYIRTGSQHSAEVSSYIFPAYPSRPALSSYKQFVSARTARYQRALEALRLLQAKARE